MSGRQLRRASSRHSGRSPYNYDHIAEFLGASRAGPTSNPTFSPSDALFRYPISAPSWPSGGHDTSRRLLPSRGSSSYSSSRQHPSTPQVSSSLRLPPLRPPHTPSPVHRRPLPAHRPTSVSPLSPRSPRTETDSDRIPSRAPTPPPAALSRTNTAWLSGPVGRLPPRRSDGGSYGTYRSERDSGTGWVPPPRIRAPYPAASGSTRGRALPGSISSTAERRRRHL
ncbi:uncharacterized protein B0T15DRAFT_544460 [Chaetomium strumarium]|uniref:Uncharacterized protein n=1 Tax=Chaetomium strumarium TaxID=1170767 RepID=A0AAJ0LXU6_9PEZI|nr:hypothetical protein B0T15DRAFT_544460 [Chaetomium strumarium]